MTVSKIDLIKQAYGEAEKNSELFQNDPYRLKYHLVPPVGLLNDPNGFIHFKGAYHIFYQWNPFETAHGAKFWAHYTSPDLVHWEEQSIALAPVDWFDKNGCYSGSAIEHEGKLVLFYTGNVKNEKDRRETYQCMAVSEDGIHFEKKGPVVTLPDGYTAHFRDPKVWKRGESWYMVIGAQTSSGHGAAALFRSNDLADWEHLGVIAGSHKNGLGDFGYMWECPDLFELDGKSVLLVSPQGIEPEGMLYQNVFQSGYFFGEMNYEEAAFSHGPFTELDRGFDFYAPQTTMDSRGRRILFAWMGITDDAEQLQPTVKNNWIHALTIPRELQLAEGKIRQSPVTELQQLRKNEVGYENVQISDANSELAGVAGRTAELLLDSIAVDGEKFELTFRREAKLTYNTRLKRLTLDRRDLKSGGREQRHCRLERLDKLQIFLDASSVEIFVNGGEEVFTARYFPDADDVSIAFSASGTARFNLKKWDI